jgi:drug/metabolite transporter (DMT)-like permease
MALWFRYLFQAVATTLAVLPTRGRAVWTTRRLPWHLLRGMLLLTSSFLAFLSLRYMPVGEFTAIVMITPLAVTLLAPFGGRVQGGEAGAGRHHQRDARQRVRGA